MLNGSIGHIVNPGDCNANYLQIPPIVSSGGVTFTTASNQTSGAFALPANSAGDLMVLFVCGEPLNSDPTDWTLRQTSTGGGADGIKLYTKESTGNEASVTLSMSFITVGINCYVFGSKDYDVSAGGNESGSGTSIAAPSVSATTSSGILVCAWGTNATSGAITVPGTMTGITQVQGSGEIGIVQMKTAYEQLVASGATGTRTATFASAFRRGKASLVAK